MTCPICGAAIASPYRSVDAMNHALYPNAYHADQKPTDPYEIGRKAAVAALRKAGIDVQKGENDG